MTEPTLDQATTPKTPGIVIFVAILNFISVSFLGLFSLFLLVALIFGNVMGVYDLAQQALTQYATTPNFSYGLTFLFAMALAVALAFVSFFILVGIGLLKGKKLAWYFQVAMSVIGLLGFPVGTLLNTVILVLFFQPTVRNFFKV